MVVTGRCTCPHRTRASGRVATAALRSCPHVARAGEDLDHDLRVVVVARNDVHRDVQAGEQLASCLVLSGFAMVGEVAVISTQSGRDFRAWMRASAWEQRRFGSSACGPVVTWVSDR